MENIDSSSWIRSRIQGYKYQEVKKTYGGILQRWLVIESQKRRESDLKHLEKKIKNEEVAVQKKLRELTSQKFACIPDAQKAPKQFFPKCLYHQLTGINIKQIEDNKSGDYCYQVQGKITVITEKVEQEKKRAGKFILATNVLDTVALTTEEMLYKYKEQQSVERGFRFLRIPSVFNRSVSFSNPPRELKL